MTEITLKIGDCRDLMKELKDGSIDLVLTDPPYGIAKELSSHRGISCIYSNLGNGRGRPMDEVIGDWDSFENEDKFLEFTMSWVDICHEKLRKGGMFVTWFDKDKINFISKHLRTRYGYKCKGYFACIKSNPVPQCYKVKWMNAWEIVGLWHKPGGKLTFNSQLEEQPDYMIVPIVGGSERLGHPTQKPEKVVKLFVKYWTNKGDWVLDPFAGSGTVGKICQDLARNCIMFEIDEKWKPIIEKRLRMNNRKLDEYSES